MIHITGTVGKTEVNLRFDYDINAIVQCVDDIVHDPEAAVLKRVMRIVETVNNKKSLFRRMLEKIRVLIEER